MPTIYYAGDSTVQYNDYTTYPQTGMDQTLGLFLKPEVVVDNHAKNGRSTKSFIDEGRVAFIYDKIKAGDFLFVQFGHNDEKSEDKARYTDPQGEFIDNLMRFANAARNKGAYPVFITPLERRCFDEQGNLKEGMHGPYVEGVKLAAKKFDVPYIDLNAMSRELLKDTGMSDSAKLYMQLEAGQYENYPEGMKDNTHLTYTGAVEFSKLVAKGLHELGGIYASLLIDGIFDESKKGFKDGETLEA